MSATLLLNASYEPLIVVPVQRAVALVLTGRAEVVDADASRPLRSPSTVMPRPLVARLVRYVRVPRRSAAVVSRRGVLARDGARCAYCAAPASTVDHVVPRSRGGPHAWENVVAACRDCNARKDDRTLDELGWRLRVTPTRPLRRLPVPEASTTTEEAWRPWLAAGR